ncbi:MAG: SufD family Fe-S cluster assembly protein [Puniceicoccales bacterium]|nr:SufD family Fe-S cluster assembly protein [Puniceicoccales bacterium]
MSAAELLSGPSGYGLEKDDLGCFYCDRCLDDRTPIRLTIGEGVRFRYFLHAAPVEENFQRVVEIDLTGPGARVEVYGLVIGSANRSLSLSISLRHSASDSHSLCRLNSIGADRADLSLVGRVTVPRGALCCSSILCNKNLRLSPSTQLRTLPILDIAAPDARCSHGTTVGGPNPQQLFYMRSRGLDQNCARKLLCDAFADEITRHFPVVYRLPLP